MILQDTLNFQQLVYEFFHFGGHLGFLCMYSILKLTDTYETIRDRLISITV